MELSPLQDLQTRYFSMRKEIEAELEAQLAVQRERFQYRLHRGKVRFERDIRELQRRYRIGVVKYIVGARLGFILTAPLIYGLIVPLVILDCSVTIYQHICFRIYRIPLSRRSDHLIFDRHHLAYLNGIEKLNCLYCSYANGLIAHVREVAARTEQFWCPIKHSRRSADPHDRTEAFFDYGDAEAYRTGLQSLRDRLRGGPGDAPVS
ncbi:hypothetical protein [Oricola cellulosilytica]|uniref:Uncharacterized protein n=1 Tax=Oricola cellulosilytica TaxID=1429082 RepID=A0A4R0PKG7_9HYPH|nr:hypothetical protein [Oricola cellulosilytica]TCD16079.1 hypothetical protein E0D97_01160 [Oricola cellulosilytica]